MKKILSFMIVLYFLTLSIILVSANQEIVLSSSNSSKTITIEDLTYTIDLISGSEDSSTIKITNKLGKTQTKEIKEGAVNAKDIMGINVEVKSAEETEVNISSILYIKLTTSDNQIELTSDDSTNKVEVDGIEYTIKLIAASDNSATIKVNDDADEINEGYSKQIGGLEVYLKSADETFLKFVATLIIPEFIDVEDDNEFEDENNETENENEFNETENEDKLNEIEVFLDEPNCSTTGIRNDSEFCSVDNKWIAQMDEGTSCENNFECNSNFCDRGECVSGNLIQKIISWFKSIFT